MIAHTTYGLSGGDFRQYTFFSDCVLVMVSCASIPSSASNPARVCLILLSWDSDTAGFSSVSVPFRSSARQLNGRRRNLMALLCQLLRQSCLLTPLQHLLTLAWGRVPHFADRHCLLALVLGSVKAFILSKDLIALSLQMSCLDIPCPKTFCHSIAALSSLQRLKQC